MNGSLLHSQIEAQQTAKQLECSIESLIIDHKYTCDKFAYLFFSSSLLHFGGGKKVENENI
jgi:hypothetical protein